MMITFAILAIAANGSWVNYTLPFIHTLPLNALNTSAYNASNSTGLQSVLSADTLNFPTFPLLIYCTLEVVYFIIFAASRGRRSYIGVQWLSTLTAVVMIDAELLAAGYLLAVWAVFFIITSLIHAFGD